MGKVSLQEMKMPSKLNLLTRGLLVIALGLMLAGFGKPIFGLEGMGDFSLASLSEWGAKFLKITTWCALVSCFLFPLRLGFLFSGCLAGGLLMLALTLGKDAVDLAAMDSEMSSSMELLTFEPGGKLLIAAMLLMSGTCLVAAFIPDKNIPDRRADGDGKDTEPEAPTSA